MRTMKIYLVEEEEIHVQLGLQSILMIAKESLLQTPFKK